MNFENLPETVPFVELPPAPVKKTRKKAPRIAKVALPATKTKKPIESILPVKKRKKRRKKAVPFVPSKWHPKEFAADLIAFREKNNVTLRKVSKVSKVSVALVYRVEANTGAVAIDTLVKLCNWMNAPVTKYLY